MKVGHLDCASGVSGDMWVGATLDAGANFAAIEAAVAALQLPGVTVRQSRVRRGALVGTRFEVGIDGRPAGEGDASDPATRSRFRKATRTRGGALPSRTPGHAHPHGDADGHGRGLDEILTIVRRAKLPAPVEARVEATFRRLGDAEAKAHGIPVERVHFHEVGAEDTIVDIVCACLGTHLLGIERVTSSAVVVGHGVVHCAHGELPVPAPGTLGCLVGIPTRPGSLAGEWTTPTGAALLATFVDRFEPDDVVRPTAIGYGAGARDVATRPNLLRLTVGEMAIREPSDATALELDELVCTLDTATGEQLAYVVDGLHALGVADAFTMPVQMKKGRPGVQVTALVDGERREAALRFLLEESTTLGVRMHRVTRRVLERWQEEHASPLGPVRFKCARLPSGAVSRRPEDDDVRRLAAEHGLSRSEALRRIGAP